MLSGGGEVILNDVMRFKCLLPHWLLLSGLDSWRIIHQQQYDDAWGIKETDIRQMMMRGWDTFPPCAKIRILLLDCTVTSFTTLPWRGQPEKWVFMSCSKPWLWAGQREVTDGFADFRSEILLTLVTLQLNPNALTLFFSVVNYLCSIICTECT